jgi:CRP-like cAMP-binding protein
MARGIESTDEKISIIRKTPFFANLSDKELLEISQKFAERQFDKGEYIFWEGEPSSYLYAIKEGKVKVLRDLPTGKRIVFEVLAAGDICGASALLAGTQIASAQAVEETKVYILSREDFLFLLDKHRGLAKEIIVFLGEKLVKLHEMIINLVSGKVEQRIASLLLGLSERHGSSVSKGTRINICLTRQDIADIVGTTVETTIRVMSKFKKQGIVMSDSKEIIITDKEQLTKIVRSS